MRLSRICAAALAVGIGVAATCAAEDVVIVVDKSEAEEIGRDAAREGKRIAREATEFAEDVAESFEEAFND